MRRKIKYRLAALCLAAAGLGAATPAFCASQPRRPSVVLVILDAVRADRTSPYGYTRSSGTGLGKLAGEASVFENAYANSNWTGASVASILTGRRPFSHGLVSRINTLSEEIPTIQSVLALNGYETAAFFTGLPGEAAYGLSRGFGHIVASEGERPLGRHVAAALEWEKTLPPGKDFFILLHGNDAHYPYRCSSGPVVNDGGSPEVNGEFIRYYNGFPGWDRSRIDPVKWKDALSYRKNASFLAAVSAAYDLCVSREDDAVSALLKGLEDLSGRPLLVIVTSDHGTLLGEHGLLGHGRHYFEPLARVPLLMRFPDGRSPRRVPDIAEHADLLPTICAVAGTSCPGGLDGRDLSAAPGGTDRSGWAAAGDIGGSSRTVIRTAAFSENGKKLTLGVRRWRLYDLAADPGETKDIAKERPEEFLRLASGYLAVSGAGKLIRAAMPEGKGEDCFWRGTGAPIQPAWSRQDYKFSARPGLWKMTKGGFSAVYSEGGGLVCENEKGLVVTDPECLAPAMAMLNCVEHHRFGDKETDEARGRNIRDALKKAGYVP